MKSSHFVRYYSEKYNEIGATHSFQWSYINQVAWNNKLLATEMIVEQNDWLEELWKPQKCQLGCT